MTFKTYRQKDEVDVAKEYTAEEIYKDLPTYSKQDKVLIIDSDILAYKVSSVCEFKYKFTCKTTGEVYNVKSKKAFKDFLRDKQDVISEKIEILQQANEDISNLVEQLSLLEYDNFDCIGEQTAEPKSYAFKTVSDAIQRALEFTGCNKYELYVGGSNNFRLKIPLPTQYKMSRTTVQRPLLLTDVKEYLIKYKGCKKVKDQECDDLVQRRMRDLNKQGIRCCLYTIDKDSKGVVDYNISIYNPDKQDIEFIKGGLGNLYETKNGIRGDGLKWLMFQTAMYDKIDNYVMNSHYLKRYGEKSFYKDFNGCTSEKELLEKLISKWKELLPEKIIYTSFDGSLQEHSWLSLAEMYYSCAKMRDGSFPTLVSLFEDYGVEYNLC